MNPLDRDDRPDPTDLERIAAALRDVPRAAYSVPHDYPSAAPAYVPAPMAARERPRADHLRLYVHLPFCRYHCTFCYFAVRVGAGPELMQRYARALVRELEWIEPGTPLSQLFVGGGTPTAVRPELLDEVLGAIFARTTPHGRHVHTVETSPETISPEHIRVLKRHGIGRVSMGVQSLDAEVLGTVRREQTRSGALDACDLLLGSGLIVNVDLMYGLPGQTEATFARDVATLAARGVPALTLYSLRTNERTPVTRSLSDQERFDLAGLMRWRAFATRTAEAHGYTQTRWHTFKRMDSIASTHERVTTFDRSMAGLQLGVGTSARSTLGYTLYRNHDKIEPYMERVERGASPVEQIYPMGEADRKTLFVARSLGDGQALERAAYAASFGQDLEADYGEVVARLVQGGLVVDGGDAIRLSAAGRLLHDLVTLAFYPEHARRWLEAREEQAALVQVPS